MPALQSSGPALEALAPLAVQVVGAVISVSLFLGAPGIISASPYAGAGFPPTFAIPPATGTQLGRPSDCMPHPFHAALLPRQPAWPAGPWRVPGRGEGSRRGSRVRRGGSTGQRRGRAWQGRSPHVGPWSWRKPLTAQSCGLVPFKHSGEDEDGVEGCVPGSC